jgi:large subunit ribosomal protein L40e
MVQLFAKLPAGNTIALSIEEAASIDCLYRKIEEREGIPSDKQRIVFGGHELEKGVKTLQDYGITADSTVSVVLRLLGGRGHHFASEKLPLTPMASTRGLFAAEAASGAASGTCWRDSEDHQRFLDLGDGEELLLDRDASENFALLDLPSLSRAASQQWGEHTWTMSQESETQLMERASMHHDFTLLNDDASGFQAMEVEQDNHTAAEQPTQGAKQHPQVKSDPDLAYVTPATPTRSRQAETRSASKPSAAATSVKASAASSVPSVPLAGPVLNNLVAKGQKGLSYDLEKVTDEKLKRRLIKNRQSAERSRQRKNAHVKELEDRLERSQYEMGTLRTECDNLNRDVARMRELLQKHGISY